MTMDDRFDEHACEYLGSPVERACPDVWVVASWDTPVPFAIPLEEGFLPKGRLKAAVDRLTNY